MASGVPYEPLVPYTPAQESQQLLHQAGRNILGFCLTGTRFHCVMKNAFIPYNIKLYVALHSSRFDYRVRARSRRLPASLISCARYLSSSGHPRRTEAVGLRGVRSASLGVEVDYLAVRKCVFHVLVRKVNHAATPGEHLLACAPTLVVALHTVSH